MPEDQAFVVRRRYKNNGEGGGKLIGKSTVTQIGRNEKTSPLLARE